MALQYGDSYSATNDALRADGRVNNAPLRRFRNVFDLAASGVGGTTNELLAAIVPVGHAVHSIRFTTDANCSAINLSAGITGNTAKYVAAAAGPNAAMQQMVMKAGALDDAPQTAPETVFITPSGNWPASGIVVIDLVASGR